jgi:hypothetical protein
MPKVVPGIVISYRYTTREQRQKQIDFFNNSVYVFDDHTVITINYKDG